MLYIYLSIIFNALIYLAMRLLPLLSGPLLAIFLIVFFDLDPQNPKVTYMAAIAIWMAVWWITQAIPLAATSLLPIVFFPVFGIMDGKDVAPLYYNYIIFLFIGGFIMALAMERWNLHKRIAINVLLTVGSNPSSILFGFMLSTAFLSMWISNTATTMMMIPIALAVVSKLETSFDNENLKPFITGLFLSIAYSASLGGVATIVGTPPNLAFARIFSITFPNAPEISFAQWMFFAFPISFVFLFVVWWVIKLFYFRNLPMSKIEPDIFKKELKILGPRSYEESVVFISFITLVVLWIFRADITLGNFIIPGWSRPFTYSNYINDGTVAVFIALILFIWPAQNSKDKIMNWETASRLPWNVILLFGGGFALAQGFKDSGLSYWVGKQLAGLEAVSPVILVMIIITMLVFLTELTSNTGSAEIFLPILAAIAVQLKVNPLFFMIPATIACSFAFMIPVATPPNALIFGTNRIDIKDMARTGIWLNISGIIIITLAIIFIGQFIFGIELSEFPDWAK
ncbi:MAG: SLC13 family permease [Candidatus Neomarinimicrobiota bacterium]|nr:MAG: SLC13 family permease [Candidatus Neomarinimicrobiota bacterium]